MLCQVEDLKCSRKKATRPLHLDHSNFLEGVLYEQGRAYEEGRARYDSMPRSIGPVESHLLHCPRSIQETQSQIPCSQNLEGQQVDIVQL